MDWFKVVWFGLKWFGWLREVWFVLKWFGLVLVKNLVLLKVKVMCGSCCRVAWDKI